MTEITQIIYVRNCLIPDAEEVLLYFLVNHFFSFCITFTVYLPRYHISYRNQTQKQVGNELCRTYY